MFDFSQILLDKTAVIIEDWVETVRQDRQIESADDMDYSTIRDHLPLVGSTKEVMMHCNDE